MTKSEEASETIALVLLVAEDSRVDPDLKEAVPAAARDLSVDLIAEWCEENGY